MLYLFLFSFCITFNVFNYLLGLYPHTDYRIEVKSKSSIGISEPTPAVTVTTERLVIPTPSVEYHQDNQHLTVQFNTTGFCVIVMVSAQT